MSALKFKQKIILVIGFIIVVSAIVAITATKYFDKNKNLNIQSAPYIDKRYNNGVKVFLVDKPMFTKTNCQAIEKWANLNIKSNDSVIYFVKNNKDTSEISLKDYKDYEKEVDLNLLCEMTGKDKKCRECRD